jgi:hypothetical protein
MWRMNNLDQLSSNIQLIRLLFPKFIVPYSTIRSKTKNCPFPYLPGNALQFNHPGKNHYEPAWWIF